ncbi:phage tail tip lysozyme [Kribbella sp. CA-293567]|uniref:phage tail tip lysozyme n=1 Tax=Kribbella sp. CA-293567 TaxID=3002436 RepID=UPI0022DDC9AE|nr:phage tail tip lysozyme [Kribbella sp. CA-293567]WBQ05714.1 phage tail tip lysozyme [Kribbella sp. CA-293567]
MGDSKAMPVVGSVMLILLLPLLLVIAMLVGVVSGMDSAAACSPSAPSESSMAWPTDKTAPDQGWDDDGDEKHKGMDFVVDKGSKVYAVEAGKVKSVSGDWIKIEHGEGLETWYQFFQEKMVNRGDEVTRGQVIGLSGEGNESAPGKSGAHLHFEVWAQGDSGGALKQADPAPLFAGGSTAGTAGGSGCGCGGAGGPLVGGSNQEKAFNFLVSSGYSKEQAAGIVGNMIHESSVEPMRLNGTTSGVKTPAATAAGLGNKAWGIVQWYPASKMINPSRAAGASFETIETLEHQLNFLVRQLDGTGPVALPAVGRKMKAAKTVDDAAYIFAHDYEIFTLNDNDPEYARRQATARQVFTTFGGGAAPAGNPGSGPATGCAAGSGNIAAVAMSLAWPEGGHGKNKSDATPAFQAALPKYNSTNGYEVWSDCGRFVATVMRMSGADPEYPMVSTGVQDTYLRTSGKYDVFDEITIAQLQPGDIFIGTGHTYMFVGSYGKYNSVAGSLGDHVPEAGYAYNVGKSKQFAVARLKK